MGEVQHILPRGCSCLGLNQKMLQDEIYAERMYTLRAHELWLLPSTYNYKFIFIKYLVVGIVVRSKLASLINEKIVPRYCCVMYPYILVLRNLSLLYSRHVQALQARW